MTVTGPTRAGRVLIVEDDADTAELERRALARTGREARWVGSVAEALEALQTDTFDVVLLDYRLPDGDSWPVLDAARRAVPAVPVILVTAMGDERVAAEVIHRGGADYLIKTAGFWDQLATAIERVLKLARVEQTNARLAALVEASDDAIFNLSLDGTISSWNAGAERLFGYEADQVIGKPASTLAPSELADEEELLLGRLGQGQATHQLDTVRRRRDGSRFEVSLSVSPVFNDDSIVVSGAVVARDVTRRRQAERRLAVRNDVTRVVANSVTLGIAGRPILEALATGLECAVGYLWVLDQDGDTTRPLAAWQRSDLAPTELEHISTRNVRRRQDIPAGVSKRVVTSIDGQADGSRFVSVLSFPISVRGNLRGAIELYSENNIVLDPALGEMLSAIALQVGEFIERCAAADALRDSERWLRLAVEAAGLGVWDLDLVTGATGRSGRHDQIFGYAEPPSHWNITTFREHVIAEDRDAVRGAFAQAMETGSLHLECRVSHPDGSIHWIAVDGQVLRDEAGRATRMIGVLGETTERKRAEEALRKSSELDRTLFTASPLPMWLYDAETLAILAANDAAVQQYGYSREELLTLSLENLRSPEDAPEHAAETVDTPHYHRAGVFRHRRKDGSHLRVEVHVHDVTVDGQRRRLALLQDVTEQQRLEDQLRQAQKMDAIGQLAGGIAHDFNNLLAVIMGYGDLAIAQLEETHPARRRINEMLAATQRAASLTRQLLAFSRKREVATKVLDLNALIADIERMLVRLIGEDIDLVTALCPTLGRVKADPSQLEQVVMNLVVNARDAMEGGGSVTIETDNLDLDDSFCRSRVDLRAGSYVVLAVTDTGSGMDRPTMERIFEPFFTTKEPGRGTGLGLATVFGIVKQSGGHIDVYSELGRGTTFRVYLPSVDAAVSIAHPQEVVMVRPQRGGETLLLVEDEAQLRGLITLVLEDAGYLVLEAADADEALAFVSDASRSIDLLVTDVVLPKMSGPELAAIVTQKHPSVATLFLSGYTSRTVAQAGKLSPDAPFLEKPFTPQTLLAKIDEVLRRSLARSSGEAG